MGVHQNAICTDWSNAACQRGLDQVLSDCKDCVDNYVDDFIFSDDVESHVSDLGRVLSRLQKA